MMHGVSELIIDNKVLKLAGGNCKSCILNYVAECVHCKLFYFGKTVQNLHLRINGPRRHMKDVINISPEEEDDENCLALHVFSMHSVLDNKGFNESFKFSVAKLLDNPVLLKGSEQKLINRYRTFKPFGLNVANPMGLKPRLVPRN